MKELQNIIECLLFVADGPIGLERFREVVEEATPRQITQALANLEAEYRQRQGGFELRQVAGGWQLRTPPRYNEYVKKFLKPAPVRLSRAALETLAIVAYKQPIIRADIEQIRGVDCGGVLRMLLERKLIKVLGRREIPGRPLIYATTKEFLEMFDLKDLRDLPSAREIEELAGDLPAAETVASPAGPDQIPTAQDSQAVATSPPGKEESDDSRQGAGREAKKT